MNEREMLLFAAKAGGINLLDWRDNWSDETGGRGRAWRTVDRELWNPLTDDGDALRLAVRLGIDLELHGALTETFKFICATANNAYIQFEETDENMDIQAATRRAITRAAAEIGKAMP